MGGVPSAADKSADESRLSLEKVKALSGNPYAATARYHKECGCALVDDYEVRRTVLGEGMSGNVVLAIGRVNGQSYALKRLSKERLSSRQRMFLQREAEVHLALDHPHVVRLVDVYETSEELALVTECCTGGELFDRVIEQQMFAEKDAAVATRQMLLALSYLHTCNIVHRDLKLENFLLASKEKGAPLKLIDFGFAKVWGPGMPNMLTCCGSVAYISPDALSAGGYTSKCDLWSIGVIVFILLAGYMPFSGDDTDIQVAIREGAVDWRGKAWRHVSAAAIDFTRALLAFDPEHRLDAKMALGHRWLAQLAAPEAPRLSKPVVMSMREYAGASQLRRAVLQLLARELLPEESRELEQLFLGLDQSNSGAISIHDLADALGELEGEQVDAGFRSCSALCLMPKKPGHQSPSSVTTADTDLHDFSSIPSANSLTSAGTDFEEWSPLGSTASTTLVGVDRTEVEALFQVTDTNGDGKVQCSEFIAAALGSRPQLRNQAVQRAFARLDADRSGSIGAEDLRQTLGGPFEGIEPGALLASSGVSLDAQGEADLHAFAAWLHA